MTTYSASHLRSAYCDCRYCRNRKPQLHTVLRIAPYFVSSSASTECTNCSKLVPTSRFEVLLQLFLPTLTKMSCKCDPRYHILIHVYTLHSDFAETPKINLWGHSMAFAPMDTQTFQPPESTWDPDAFHGSLHLTSTVHQAPQHLEDPIDHPLVSSMAGWTSPN